jgi:hypothetical protein
VTNGASCCAADQPVQPNATASKAFARRVCTSWRSRLVVWANHRSTGVAFRCGRGTSVPRVGVRETGRVSVRRGCLRA